MPCSADALRLWDQTLAAYRNPEWTPHQRPAPDPRLPVRDTFGDRVATTLIRDVYLPGYHELGVQHPQANKRDAVRWLAERLGIPLSAVTAIGDNHNDLPMFEVAGRRLAVANAEAEVHAAADRVLGSNDEDGVAVYLAEAFDL